MLVRESASWDVGVVIPWFLLARDAYSQKYGREVGYPAMQMVPAQRESSRTLMGPKTLPSGVNREPQASVFFSTS